jgi:hypothetical protein
VTTRSHSFIAIALLAIVAACGGGGKDGFVPSTTSQSQPASSKTGIAIFKLKLPSAATMAKAHVKRQYQSQATQGVAMTWAAAESAASPNPYTPNFAAPVAQTCPTTLPAGVTACGIDPTDGGTDYTFQIPIPVGTWNFTVSTFDQAPSGSPLAYAANANMLAQGSVGAIAIAAGTSNTIPNLTFYGIPVSVSLVAAPGQAHVVQYSGSTVASGGAPEIAVVGSAPQSFYAEPLDADGYLIDDNDGNSGSVPTVAIAESLKSTCYQDNGGSPCFTIAQPAPSASPYLWTMQATSALAVSTIDVTATLPAGASPNGVNDVQSQYLVLPVQEVFTAQSSGIYGYPLYPGASSPPTEVGNAIDEANVSPLVCSSSGQSCQWTGMAADSSGNLWAVTSTSSGTAQLVFEFKQSAQGLVASTGTSPSAAATTLPAGAQPAGMAIDSHNYAYITDANDGDVYAFNTASLGTGFITVPVNTELGSLTSGNYGSSTTTYTVAVPPTGSSLAGEIWIAGETSGTAGSANFLTNFSSASGYTPSSPPPVQSPYTGSLAGTPYGMAFNSSSVLFVYFDTIEEIIEYSNVGGALAQGSTIEENGSAGAYELAFANGNVPFIGSAAAPSPEGACGFLWFPVTNGSSVNCETNVSGAVGGIAVVP